MGKTGRPVGENKQIEVKEELENVCVSHRESLGCSIVVSSMVCGARSI
jgi:hypothetical protein